MSSVRRDPYRESAELRYPISRDSATPLRSIAHWGSAAAAKKVAEIFAVAGIKIGGSNPWDLQIHDERFYQRLLSEGDLGAGESYMDGWWDAEALDEFCTRVHRANLAEQVGEWRTICATYSNRFGLRSDPRLTGSSVCNLFEIQDSI